MNTQMPGSDARGRWWLDPALAQLAFGEGHPDGAALPMAAAVEQAIWRAAGFDLDPTQAETRVFGEFELLEVLGQGGMGRVYRARQLDLDREVALKLLSAGCNATRQLTDTLRREAQHAARLQHPNIVTVYGLGEHEGLLCYSMQLVRGRSLSQWLEAEGRLPPRRAAALLRTIAEAAHYAHRLGVLHLDLKPGNILIDDGGEPLIADFGLARNLEHAGSQDAMAGTPGYMAPEQVRPEYGPLTPASDVWALGAILYEMLTGHPPFDAGTPAETLRLLLEGVVRRPSRYTSVPGDLEAICLHCLAKHPELRYQSARELADDLSRFLDDREVSVRRLPLLQRMLRRGRREPREVMILALLGLLALALGGALSLQWTRSPAAACPPALATASPTVPADPAAAAATDAVPPRRATTDASPVRCPGQRDQALHPDASTRRPGPA